MTRSARCGPSLPRDSNGFFSSFRFLSFRIIGQRWKNIDPDRLSKYSELAAEDTERYKTEMQAYNGRQEAKMRQEALKPPVTFSGSSAAVPGDRPSYPDARVGYGDMAGAGFPGMGPGAMGPGGMGPGGPASMGPGAMGGGYGYGYGDFPGYGSMGMSP